MFQAPHGCIQEIVEKYIMSCFDNHYNEQLYGILDNFSLNNFFDWIARIQKKSE